MDTLKYNVLVCCSINSCTVAIKKKLQVGIVYLSFFYCVFANFSLSLCNKIEELLLSHTSLILQIYYMTLVKLGD